MTYEEFKAKILQYANRQCKFFAWKRIPALERQFKACILAHVLRSQK